MSIEENKRLVRRFYDEFTNTGNLAAADELVAPNFVLHFGGSPEPVRGPEGIKQLLIMLRTAFPDMRWTIEDVVAEGDKVAERVVGHGTHLGAFQGIPPTGRPVLMKGLSIFRIAEGRIAENWAMPDMLGLLQQLGVIIPSGQARE